MINGSCVRDYIHINDSCEAHSLALLNMLAHDKRARYNLGNGKGFSVKKVIDTAREVSGNIFIVAIEPRRCPCGSGCRCITCNK